MSITNDGTNENTPGESLEIPQGDGEVESGSEQVDVPVESSDVSFDSILLPPPTINLIKNISGSPYTGAGTGISGAIVFLYIPGTQIGPIGSARVTSGTWSGAISFPANVNKSRIDALQRLDGEDSERTAPMDIYRAILTYPQPNAIEPARGLIFRGIGAPNSKVVIVKSPPNHGEVLSAETSIDGQGNWQAPLTANSLSGPVSVSALISYVGTTSIYTLPVLFTVQRDPPVVIGYPNAGSLQDQTFYLKGNGGTHGSKMRVLLDLTDTKVGEAIVEGDGWTVRVSVAPGPVSLVAVQDTDNIPSEPSRARSFKIRPPTLEGTQVSYPTDTTIKFSGEGHDGATVEITNDGNAPPPPPVVVANGEWETIATNWPMGTYKLTLVQKLSDNAGGWIESLPLEFTFNKALPDVSDLKHTVEYRPTFSGKGFNGATVHVRHPNSSSLAAPTTVVSGNQWSTTASAVWGPSNNREVHIKQILNGQWSPTWCVLKVTIPPLAPGLNVPAEEGLSPVFSGTGWSGAEVHINFNGDSQTHKAPVAAEVWTFQRATPFIADTPHTIEVRQFAEGLESPKAAKTFTIYPVVEQPVITYPLEGSEVPRDLSVTGSGGMAGATMRLWDDRYGRYLTSPQRLDKDGEWVIALTGLAFDEHVIRAEQTIYSRPFKRSEQRKFKVVVSPPEITCPNAGQKLPRTSKLTGKGMPHARVEVWMLGETSAPLTEANVDGEGNWSTEVTLPVGHKTISALQIYDDDGVPQKSRDSDRVTYQVVPKAFDIESPTTDEHAGRALVVSGFGVPGDTVTVKVGSTHRSAPVRADRTWSVRLEPNQPGGDSVLEAVSALDEFESEPATRPIVLSTYAPTVEIPALGSWVANPVSLSGSGRQGIGEVVSWFNPDLVMTANIPVDPLDGWRAQAGLSLMRGGQWSRFRQSLNDVEKRSDWVDSERFEVEPGSSKLS